MCRAVTEENEPEYHTGAQTDLGGQEEEGLRETHLGTDLQEPPKGPSMNK